MLKGNGEDEIPWWWNLTQAAKYLNVPVWELAEQPYFWMQVAITCMNAEAEIQERESKKRAKK